MNRKRPPQLIHYGDWFDAKFADFVMGENSKELRSLSTDKKYRVGDTDESYRVINNWGEMGLLLDDENRDGGWRKFSLVDLCWTLVMREMRQFGFSLEKLKNLKDSIFCEYTKNAKEDTSLFEFYMMLVLGKKDVIIVVSHDGWGSICLEADYNSSQIGNPLPKSYAIVSLNRIYAGVANRPDLLKKNETFLSLTSKELEIMDRIAFDDELVGIDIKPKKGKIGKVSYITQKVNPEEAIAVVREMLKNGDRKEITLKQQDGKVVMIEQVDKR